MKLRWKILIAMGIILILIGGSLVVTMRVQPGNELEAYKKQLRAQGEKLDLADLIPQKIAAESNSIDAIQEAFRLSSASIANNNPYLMQMIAPGKAMAGWKQPEVRGADFTNSWEDFSVPIAADKPALDLLWQVLDRPQFQFDLDYKRGFQMLFPHLAPLKRSVQKLASAGALDLHNGNTGAAATNILVSLALIDRDFGNDVLISHLVRLAMANIVFNATWEILQSTNVTAAQLAALQDAWRRPNLLKDAETVFQLERACSIAAIQKSRKSHKDFQEVFDSGGSGGIPGMSSGGGPGWLGFLFDATEGPRAAAAEGLWRSSWSYSEELGLIQEDQIILESLRTMQTNRAEFYQTNFLTMSASLASLGHTNLGEAFFRALGIPDFRGYMGGGRLHTSVARTLRTEIARRVVVTAIALKRFQLKNGRLPQTLNDLAPEFIPSVPIDSYDGMPLKYHPGNDGTFLLYSVGDDGKDDGGDTTAARSYSTMAATWYWQRSRDWVWPQPATPEEIQNYHEHPPNP